MTTGIIHGTVLFNEQFLEVFDTTDDTAGKCKYTIASAGTVAALGINGGAARMSCGANDDDAASIAGPVAFEVDESILVTMQARIRISDVSVASVFVGFSDAISDAVVVQNEDDGLDTTFTDGCGILLEGEVDVTWTAVGVDTDVDKTEYVATNIDDLADAEWTTIRIELTAKDSGTMKVYIDGKLMKTATHTSGAITSYFDSAIVFCPIVSCDARATAYTVDVFELVCEGNVGASAA